MKILLVIKSPFLDRIPNLKALVLHLCEEGHSVTILSGASAKFTVLTSHHPNLRLVTVAERTRKFELPTFIKLGLKLMSLVASNSYDLIIGGDAHGNILASEVAKVKKIPYVCFVLEYPQIADEQHMRLSRMQKLENACLSKAQYIITHDKWHEEFLRQHFSINGKVLHLPNASFTPPYTASSTYLGEKYSLDADKAIILHSGGFMDVFRCQELMATTKEWTDEMVMVFHASHKIMEDPYFIQSKGMADESKIRFSLQALDNETLDKMVASADVGIALYSVEILGYRAQLMGLAAGKIGNYLKCGVPVIATRVPSLKYIEDYECGFLIDDESEIPQLVQKIMSNREFYREKAFRCYAEKWELSSYLKEIEKCILGR